MLHLMLTMNPADSWNWRSNEIDWCCTMRWPYIRTIRYRYIFTFRYWSLITGKGGGGGATKMKGVGACEVLPLGNGGGGEVLTMLKGGGAQQVLG